MFESLLGRLKPPSPPLTRVQLETYLGLMPVCKLTVDYIMNQIYDVAPDPDTHFHPRKMQGQVHDHLCVLSLPLQVASVLKKCLI